MATEEKTMSNLEQQSNKKNKLEDIIAMTVTPMHPDESVNYDAFNRQIDWCVKQGVNGIVILPSIGEVFHFEPNDRIHIMGTMMDYIKSHYPHLYMITMTAETYSSAVVKYAQAAKSMGYDAQQIIPPHYWRPAKSNIMVHFQAAARTGLDIVTYNNPGLSKVNLERPFIKKLAEEIVTIKAIKETETDPYNELEPLFDEVEGKIKIFTTFRAFGWGLLLGSSGGFINIPTVPVCTKMLELHKTKTYDAIIKLVMLQRAMGRTFPKKGEFSENPLALTKAMASVVTGIEMGAPKMPYEAASKEFVENFKQRYIALQELMAATDENLKIFTAKYEELKRFTATL